MISWWWLLVAGAGGVLLGAAAAALALMWCVDAVACTLMEAAERWLTRPQLLVRHPTPDERHLAN